MMNNEEIAIVIEINCETGVETTRRLTPQEIAQRTVDIAKAESDQIAKELKAAQEEEERQSLLSWIASQSTLPQAARNALARAAGIDTTTSSSQI